MIEIDGSYLEGGGAILRVAVALSAITGKPVKIFNIRAKRCNPGLRPQHMKGIEACAEICNGEVKGAKIGSKEVEFFPGRIKTGEYDIDIGTAGSIPLILQTLVLPCIHADGEVVLNIKGGTDGKWAPTMAFFEAVFCGNMKKMGIGIEIKVLRAGFYPKGGGEARVRILPCKEIKSVTWVERGEIRRIDCWSFASKYLEKANVAERQMKGFEEIFSVECRDVQYVDSFSPGSSITAHAHCNTVIGASALGERGKRAEEVGRECAELLKKQIDSGACLDRWMADQILPYIALAAEHGKSEISVSEITNHCLTNIWVIEKFLPVKFSVEGKLREKGIISVGKI